MPVVHRIDHTDARVAAYRVVSDPALARREGVFIAEGRFVVTRLIEGKRFAVQSVLLNEASLAALAAVIETLPPETPIYVASAEALAVIAGFHIHRGCLALATRPPDAQLEDVAASARSLVVLDEVTNADNVGGVFRNAAAFGVDAVILSPGTCDPLYRKAIRTSMAAALRVPFARATAWPADLARIRSMGFTIVALTPRQPSQDLATYASMPRPERLALLVGAEGDGLSDGALALASHRVRIPISSHVDSLNLAVATGIALARLSSGVPLW